MEENKVEIQEVEKSVEAPSNIGVPPKPIVKKEEQTNTDLKKDISIMVCTPVHSEVSMHYTQAL
jgi:hypothetical protein